MTKWLIFFLLPPSIYFSWGLLPDMVSGTFTFIGAVVWFVNLLVLKEHSESKHKGGW